MLKEITCHDDIEWTDADKLDLTEEELQVEINKGRSIKLLYAQRQGDIFREAEIFYTTFF